MNHYRPVHSVIFILMYLCLADAAIMDYISKIYAASKAGVCNLVNCCHESWEYANIRNLAHNLKTKVYGQHIVNEYVINALKNHIKGKNDKPLVMSFHGLPGVGKNYVTNFIKESLFKYGEKDTHIHSFSGRLHFRIKDYVETYQDWLSSWVRGNVSQCRASLFIFDEVDKMPPGIFYSIKPYLDHHSNIDGVDFRNSIFIFISDTGSQAVLEQMINLYRNGKTREALQLNDFEDLITQGAYNEEGGFQKSDAISSNVVDHYIPFLPLEEQHVILCIEDAFRSKDAWNVSHDDIQEVLQHITYGPEEMKIFSRTGCKRIVQKVAVVVEKKRYAEKLEL